MASLTRLLRFLLLFACAAAPVRAADIQPRPLQYEMPAWFRHSFLEIPQDVQEAQARGKKLLVFFHMENCPFCAHLLHENFADGKNRVILEKHFDVVAINVKGDLPVNWIDGTLYTEKQLARKLDVYATPVVLVLGGGNVTVLKKIAGYKKSPEFMQLLLGDQ